MAAGRRLVKQVVIASNTSNIIFNRISYLLRIVVVVYFVWFGLAALREDVCERRYLVPRRASDYCAESVCRYDVITQSGGSGSPSKLTSFPMLFIHRHSQVGPRLLTSVSFVA